MSINKILIRIALVSICILGICISCDNNKGRVNPINFITTKSSDTSLFELNNGKYCQNIINIQATLPINQYDSIKLDSITNLLLFNIDTKTINNSEIFTEYCKNLKADYGQPSNIESVQREQILYDNHTNINIKPVYNKNDIISLVKSVITTNNRDTTANSNNYYNIDIRTAKEISLVDLFANEDLEIVQQILVNNLFNQLEITNADELDDFGYFDANNIIATNNFYFTDNGIVWCYPVYEIACYAVGETNILVTYNQLESILIKN
ncbi:MAG: RsiV family protein [Bacteroidales bacterium]